MARWQPVPVVGGAYTDDCKPWASQDCVNRIPVMAEREGTRSPAMLRDAPGCAVFSILGTDSPIRGMHNAEGKLFVVSAQTLYQVGVTGAATSLGTIPGVGRVSMAHNQIAGGNELAIANGQSGYVYNTVTGVLAQISDEGFPGAKVFDFCDGYMMFVEKGGRYWGHSDLAAATEYNTLDRSEAEAQPDKIVTAAVSHREWVVFGERSTEFYRNEGGTTGTFQRINGTEAEIGAAGTHTVAKLDNTLFVVGHDRIGYRLNGYQFVRITTHAIEQAWARCDMSQAYCYTFDDRGHKVWYVTSTDGQTFGYDVATGEWHRRKSYGLDFWRMSDLVRWNGVYIGGDYSNGRLYQLDWRLSNDAGDPLERSRTFAVMHDSGNRVVFNGLRLKYSTGLTSDSPPLPQLLLSDVQITGDLGNGTTGEVVSYQYTVTGGIPPNVVTITSGALPDGLSMDSDGLITGTRTTVGGYTWTVRVTDSTGDTDDLIDESVTLAAGCVDVMDPTLAAVHYLLLDDTDVDDTYAEAAYDYSAWDTGMARFDSHPDVAVTLIPISSKIWCRHEIVLASTAGVQFQYHVDNEVELWINGVLILTDAPGGSIHVYDIDPADLTVGCNHIAISGRDTGGGRMYLNWKFLQ